MLRAKYKAFSLFETILALVILSIVISGFSKILTQNNSFKIYSDLQKIENNFNQTNNVENIDTINLIQYQ